MRPFFILWTILFTGATLYSQTTNSVKVFEKDTIATSKGDLVITFIGHASLMIEAGKRVIYTDPVMMEADYSAFPKADLILVTHEHADHFDKKAIDFVTQPLTITLMSQSCKGLIDLALIFVNGQK